MTTTRRNFIQQATQGVIGTWMLTSVPVSSPARYIISNESNIAADDEQFWSIVRDQFPLTHDRVYFNNGTIGPSPFVVREAVKSAIDTIDTSGEYGGGEAARPKIPS